MDLKIRVVSATGMGVVLWIGGGTGSESPSWPEPSSPQQYAVPATLSAQACDPPALTVVNR
jgi:hypothetical protein